MSQPKRFEEQVNIKLRCCRTRMELRGNLSLREASANFTMLAYECSRCRRRVTVMDEWVYPNAEVIDATDMTA